MIVQGRSLQRETAVCVSVVVFARGSTRVRDLGVRTTGLGGCRSKAGWGRQDRVGPFGCCLEVFTGKRGGWTFRG